MPIGIALLPVAWRRLTESTGPNRSLDLPGLGLASVGLLGIVWGLVRGNEHGWTSLGVAGPIAAGIVLVGAFVLWELRTREPMVPMRFFRKRAFSAANVTSLLMSFGMFGAIFLLAQYFQVVQGYSPLQAGLRTLPWTAMLIFVAPICGIMSDRIGTRPLLVAGMALMAAGLTWIAVVTTPMVAYERLIPAFVMAGVGMSLYFAPVANLVLSTVRRREEGKASGVNNTVREVDGMTAALWVGAAAVAVAGLAAVAIPSRQDVVPDSASLLERPDGGDGVEACEPEAAA